MFGSDQTIWYPASGYRYYDDGGLSNVGDVGYYWSWSASPYSDSAFYLGFNYNGDGGPSNDSNRAYGYSVRCLHESK